MEYFLSEEQQMIVDTAKDFALKVIKPVREEHDENQTFPGDVVKKMG